MLTPGIRGQTLPWELLKQPCRNSFASSKSNWSKWKSRSLLPRPGPKRWLRRPEIMKTQSLKIEGLEFIDNLMSPGDPEAPDTPGRLKRISITSPRRIFILNNLGWTRALINRDPDRRVRTSEKGRQRPHLETKFQNKALCNSTLLRLGCWTILDQNKIWGALILPSLWTIDTRKWTKTITIDVLL